MNRVRDAMRLAYATKLGGVLRPQKRVGTRRQRDRGVPFATPVFDGAKETDIVKMLGAAGLMARVRSICMMVVTGEPFDRPVTVG